MRTFGTIVFGLLFIVAFVGFFLAHSAVGFPLSTESVVETAKEVELYDVVMETVDMGMQEAVRQADNKQLAEELASGMGDTLKDAIPEDWFYENFEKAWAGLVAFVEGGEDVAEIDLKEQKEQLRKYIDGVVDKYAPTEDEAERARKELDDALKVVPDTVTIGALFSKAGNDAPDTAQLEDLRDNIKEFEKYRMMGLGGLLGLLFLLILLAAKSPKRFLISIGIILTLSSGLYLAVTNVGTDLLIEEAMKEHESTASSESERFAEKKGIEVAQTAIRSAVQRSDTLVAGIGAAGLLMFIIGFFVRGAAPADTGPSGRELYGRRG